MLRGIPKKNNQKNKMLKIPNTNPLIPSPLPTVFLLKYFFNAPMIIKIAPNNEVMAPLRNKKKK